MIKFYISALLICFLGLVAIMQHKEINELKDKNKNLVAQANRLEYLHKLNDEILQQAEREKNQIKMDYSALSEKLKQQKCGNERVPIELLKNF